MVHNPSGSCDYDVWPIVEFDGLRNHVHASNYDGSLDVEGCPKSSKLLYGLQEAAQTRSINLSAAQFFKVILIDLRCQSHDIAWCRRICQGLRFGLLELCLLLTSEIGFEL